MYNNFQDLIAEHESSSANLTTNENSRLLVYSTRRHSRYENYSMLIGGLADRLKGIISAYLFSIYTNRAFAIEWFSPCPLEPSLTHALCDWRTSTWSTPLRNPKAVRHLDLIDQVGLFETISPEEIVELLSENEQVVYINTNIFSHTLCNKMFPNFNTNEVFKAAFDSLFQFNVPHQFLELLQDVHNHSGNLIGVHWRTGGGNGWDDPHMGEWSKADEAIEFALEKAKEKGLDNPVVYFATDSDKAKSKVLEREWKNKIIMATQEVGHIDKVGDNARDSFDYALTEFMILSKCDLIFGGAGQYWLSAALVGGKEATYISL